MTGTDSAVFVPGVMGAGLLVSLVVLVGDAARRIASGRSEGRHARVAASAVAAGTAAAVGQGSAAPPDALRPRWVYGLVAAAFLSAAGYLLVAGSWNYIDQPWAMGTAWLWAMTAGVGSSFAWIGVAATAVALRWPWPPPFAWPLLRRTSLGAARPRASRR